MFSSGKVLGVFIMVLFCASLVRPKVQFHKHTQKEPIGFMRRGFEGIIDYLNFSVTILKEDDYIRSVNASDDLDGDNDANNWMMAVAETDDGIQNYTQQIMSATLSKAQSCSNRLVTKIELAKRSKVNSYSSADPVHKVEMLSFEDLMRLNMELHKDTASPNLVLHGTDKWFVEVFKVTKTISEKRLRSDRESKKQIYRNKQGIEYQSWTDLMFLLTTKSVWSVDRMCQKELDLEDSILSTKVFTMTIRHIPPHKLTGVIDKINKYLEGPKMPKNVSLCVDEYTAYDE